MYISYLLGYSVFLRLNVNQLGLPTTKPTWVISVSVSRWNCSKFGLDSAIIFHRIKNYLSCILHQKLCILPKII